MSPVNKLHFDRLLEIHSAAADQRESWTGRLASRYARECDPACSVLEDRYWNEPLSRAILRSVCLDANNPSDAVYVAVMAWGKQHFGNFRQSWRHRPEIVARLDRLRSVSMARGEAYDLFARQRIGGLGPAYFTKLLFFCSPGSHHRIMDQWAAKSINLLFDDLVPMKGKWVSQAATASHYESYCGGVDWVAGRLGCEPAAAEMFLFSGRGSPWRRYVEEKTPA